MKRICALVLALFSVAAFAQITYTDYSGSITTGGTSQTLAAASNGRVRIAILNPSTETENLCVNLTSAASCTPGSSWIIQPGQSVVIDSTEAVTVVAATTGHKWIAKAGVGPGFASNGTSTAGGGFSASVTLTRTADTNAYTANDVIGSDPAATAALTFSSMCSASSGRVIITSASLEIDASALISGETSYVLHLYSVTPPSALGDNAAFDLPSGDRTSYLGSINLGTPVDLGSTLYVATDGINKQIRCASSSIYGYLVTVGAYTPTSARVYVVNLHGLQP